jgi:hypothetical protein
MALLQGVTNWLFRPALTGDGTGTPNAQRMGKYNELSVVDYYRDQYPAALEGSYFVAATPTPGTGVAATATLQAYASCNTTPWAVICNMNTAGGANIELDYMKIIQTAAQLPTTSTSVQIAMTLDTVAAKIPTTAGTVLTKVNVNAASSNVSNALINCGAVTTGGDSPAVRLVWQDVWEPTGTTPVVAAGDQLIVKFGAAGVVPSNYYQLIAGTPLQVKQIALMAPPMVVPPGWAAVVKIWLPALGAVAQTYSFELGYRER